MAVATVQKLWTIGGAGLVLGVRRETISDLVIALKIETFEMPGVPNGRGINSKGMARLAKTLKKQWPLAEVA